MLEQVAESSQGTVRDLLLVALGGAMTLAGGWIEHQRRRRAEQADEVRLAYAEWMASFERMIIAARVLYLHERNGLWSPFEESAADVRVRVTYTDAHHALTRAHVQLLLLEDDNPVLKQADEMQSRVKTPAAYDQSLSSEQLKVAIEERLKELDDLQALLPGLVKALRCRRHLSA